MKLLKLSLVAVLSAGALATVSSATPLEEAIKNVDLGGSLLLRYDYKSTKKDGDSSWKVKGTLDFKTKFDDNFFAVAGLKVEDNNDNQNGRVDLYNGYLGYTNGGTTVIAGRYTLGTFFTDDLWGTGVKVTNSDIEGLTLAGLWADQLNISDGDFTVGAINTPDDLGYQLGEAIGYFPGKRDVFGLAAIGSYEPVNFQLWFATASKVANLYAAELGFDFDTGNNNKISLVGQYGKSSINGNIKGAYTVDPDLELSKIANGDIYGVKLGFDFSGVDFSAGYVDYSTKKDAISLVSLEDKGSFISAGEQTDNSYNGFAGANNLYFATIGFGIPDSGFNVGFDYVHNTNKTESMNEKNETVTDTDRSNEYVARLGYDYSKKLKFSSYYSNYQVKGSDVNHKFRFQVKYSF